VTPLPRKDSQWTDKELVNLTAALQRYGFYETKKISEMVKTKDENAVKHFLSVEVAKVRCKMARENQWPSRQAGGGSWHHPDPCEVRGWPVVRKWRRVVLNQMRPCIRKNDYSKILMVDLFESFYNEAEEPSDPQMMNVKAIYKYLLDCMRGYVPAELSPIDSAVVLLMLGQLKEMQQELDFDEEKAFMKNFKRAKSFAPIKVKDEFRERTQKRSEAVKNVEKEFEMMNISDDSSSTTVLEVNDKEEEEKNTIYVEENMYEKLSKHRKLVQSFNPLNVPMWTLVKQQAYVQNKCETVPRPNF